MDMTIENSPPRLKDFIKVIVANPRHKPAKTSQ